VFAEVARASADASDRLRSVRIVPSLIAGVPISIKDLTDVAPF
jgi:Asp-tRNA(Asn)/Glu-tRNA(Gln) amidotransferase A subunit family amidase